jgi:nucleoside-specific outer membrane channel protein Tsx
VIAKRVIVSTILAALSPWFAATALAQDDKGFSSSNLQVLYGWNFRQPDIVEDVPKNVFTFENTSAGRWWSSYLFVDVLRSWSEADANAKEVYGEWYPSLSLRKLVGADRSKGFLRDVGLTAGLNTGVRSTGPSPFVVLPGVTFDLGVKGFAFLSVGAFVYIDRGRFQGQPTECQATTWQITPSWSLPLPVGSATLKTDGFVDFIGSHANCMAQVLSQSKLMLDLSGLWKQPGRLYVGVEWAYWRNKYGISGLKDNVLLPVVVWVL